MSTLEVKIVKIDEINSHPNADRLDLATIGGWQCVVGKDTYKAGDSCVYIPIDAILPEKLEYKIFPPEAKVKLEKHRIKTIRLRGAISQGLVVSLETLGLSADVKIGTDLREKLGITKYEPIVKGSPQQQGAARSKKQTNPNFRKYTGIENFKNYIQLFEDGEEVSITEKVHGSNFRAGYVEAVADTFLKKIKRFFKLLPKYEFVYGSHNVQLQNKILHKGYYDTDIYGEAVNKYNLKDKLKPGEVLYGEVYGSGIQGKYTYGCKENEHKLAAFDLMLDGKYVDPPDFFTFCEDRGIPKVKELYRGPFSLAKAKELASGDSVFANQKVIEGVVIKPMVETLSFMGRKVLKLINDDYLTQKNLTEFH